MNEAVRQIRRQLYALRDESYGNFTRKLIPTLPPERVIGIRTPALRGLAKALWKTPSANAFMQVLPHDYHEENCLHAFLVEQIKDYDQAIAEVTRFLPYVDNWATCDSMSPKVFKKHLSALYGEIQKWAASGKTYTVRFALGMLMNHYLGESFQPEHLALAASVRSSEYYVNMMVAWYFATALAKQYEAALPYLQERRLDPWTHNKTIQKAIESYRVSDARKQYLRTLKL